MEVVDQSEIPRVGGVDLVVGSHLHPFLEIRQDGDTLHRRDAASSHGERLVIVVPIGPRCSVAGAWGSIVIVIQPQVALLRCGSSSLQFVDLFLVERFPRVQPTLFLLGIVVQGDSIRLVRTVARERFGLAT